MAGTLISVEDVTKSFGGFKAVDHCSFGVAEGSITGLIGPNGAGKTTVFNMIAGLFPPTSGRIVFDGQEMTHLAPEQRFRRGLVRTFQIPHEFGRMTVLENLMLVPGMQSGESLFNAWFRWSRVRADERAVREKAEEVLDFVKMGHLKNQLAGEISGGQKKLLELGRTLMTDARAVLLDEPGAGVNRTLLGELAGMIRRLNTERGYTFCIVEHDMDLIAELCDPVIVMAEGSVLTQGTMAEIRANDAVLEAYLGRSGAEAEAEANA